jgi:hypothetical protein
MDWHAEMYTVENAQIFATNWGARMAAVDWAVLALWPLAVLLTLLPFITLPLTLSNFLVCKAE